ncbi:MAG: DUF4321 domain-containing protein [Calditrichaeota bacterium]|nr:MAG: DUF4321 domain-containing protein [Calditrichota bacterium]
MLGTLLGELLGLILPEGVVKQFFLLSWDLSVGPAKLDAILFSLTLGFSLKVNVVGVIGVATAIYILRWY